MIRFNFEEDCSGCGGCANICPVSAITMESGANGFRIPRVDVQACISCGRCDAVCPHLNGGQGQQDEVKGAWLYASGNREAKLRSASGAAFYELAEAMRREGAWICGCVWDEQLNAVHIVGDKPEDLQRMQGSKYVQSDTGTCYSRVLDLLKQGKRVLFSGTPCQAVAVHRCVMTVEQGRYRSQLITVGVLCHGVASPMAWNSYKQWAQEKQASPLVAVNFRDKSQKGYQRSYCRYEYASGKVEQFPTYLPTSKYIEATLVYNLALRASCSHCDCKGANPGCDLILGDWYAECRGEGALGTSCVVAFTQAGLDCAEKYLAGLRPVPYEDVVAANGLIERSERLGQKREEFFDRIARSPRAWDRIESLYPPKYPLKKILVKLGLFDLLKKIIG